MIWSEETFRIFQYERTTKPTLERVLQRVHPEDAALVKQTIERASLDGRDFDCEHRLLMPDGSIKHLRVVAHAVDEESGNIEFVGAVMDVTSAKDAEERIRQDERELRATIETIPAFITSSLADGSLDIVNQSLLDYSGLSREEWIGTAWVNIVHPDDIGMVMNKWRRELSGGEPLDVELRFRRADGRYRWFLGRVVPWRDEAGNINKWYGTLLDIEGRKQAEARLRQSEAQLHEAQRLGHMGSSVRNVSSGDFIASPEFLRIFGFDPDEEKPTFEMIRDRVHPDDVLGLVEIVNRSLSEKRGYELDYRIVLPDGSIRYCHTVANPVFDGVGDVAEYFNTTLDVTERKQAAEALQRSRNTFRAMVEKSGTGILLMRPDTNIIYASPSVERVLGYTPQELAGQPLTGLAHPDYIQHSIDTWTQLLQEPDYDSTAEVMARHKDGSWRWIESTTRNLLHEPGVQAVVVNFRDITERKLAQAERERLQLRPRQAEEMEAGGRLAGGHAPRVQ